MMREINLYNTEKLITLVIILAFILGIAMAVRFFISSHSVTKTLKKTNKEKPPGFTAEDFELFYADTCEGLAFYLDTETQPGSAIGDLSLQCAAIILRGLAENMYANETLSEYFQRKNNKE